MNLLGVFLSSIHFSLVFFCLLFLKKNSFFVILFCCILLNNHREVEQAVNAISTLFQQWRQILEDSPNSADYFSTTKEIKESIKAVEWDIQYVNLAFSWHSHAQGFGRNCQYAFFLFFFIATLVKWWIGVVEKNRQKFNIDPAELANRKAFIQKVRDSIAKTLQELDSPETAGKLQSNSREVRFVCTTNVD